MIKYLEKRLVNTVDLGADKDYNDVLTNPF